MQKEKFSIRKTTVGAVSARIAVIGLLSLMGLAQEVKADEFVTTSAEVVEAETTATPETVIPEQVEQARQDLALAQATVAQDQTAVEQALTTEQVAKENLTLAQEQVQTSQDFLNQASPEAIAQAEQTVATEQNQLTQLTEATEQKESQATAQDKKATEAEKQAQAKSEEQKQAEETLSQAKDNLNQLSQQEKEVKTTLATAEKEVAQAQENLHQAEATEQDRQAAIAKAKEDWESKKATEEQSGQEVEKLTTELQTKTTELSQAESALTSAKAALESDNQTIYPQTITVTEEWKTLFKQFLYLRINDNLELFNETLDKLSDVGKVLLDENPFTVNGGSFSNNEDAIYDPNNLPEDLVNELNIYFTTLINSLHAQLGDGKTVVANSNIIKFAEDVASEYKRLDELGDEGVTWWNNHNITAINNAAEKHGLDSSATANMYENGHWGVGPAYFENASYVFPDRVNRHFLFMQVHSAAIGMMLYDYGRAENMGSAGGHAESIYTAEVLGLNFSMYPYDYDTDDTLYHLNTHILQVSKDLLAPPSLEDYRAAREEAGSLRQQYNEEIKQVDAINQQLNEVSNEMASYLDDKGWIAATNPNYNRFLELHNEAERLRGQVNAIRSEVNKLIDKARNITGQALLKLNNDRDEIFESLYSVNSPDILTAPDTTVLQENLNKAQSTYQQAKSEVEVLEKNLRTAQTTDKANQEITRQAKEAYDKLLAGTVNKAQAQANLEQAQADELIAKNKLSELEKQVIQARQNIEQAQIVLDELKPLVAEAQDTANKERSSANALAVELANLAEKLVKTREQLDTSRQRLENLQNAEKNSQLAQENLEQAELTYTEASNRLKELVEILQASRENRDGKQVYLDYLTALLAQQTEVIVPTDIPQTEVVPADGKAYLESDKAEPSPAGGAVAAAAGQDKSVTNRLTGVGSSERPLITATTAGASYSRLARANGGKTLPSTGDSGTALTVLGFGLTALGLTTRKRRKA